jgi:hypothetical protein
MDCAEGGKRAASQQRRRVGWTGDRLRPSLRPNDNWKRRWMAPQPPTTGQPGLATPLTDKLTRLVSLSPEEIAVLGDLQSTIRTVARNREIISESRKYDGLLVLTEGVSIRYRIPHDGRRQVLTKHHLARGFHRFSRMLFRERAVFRHSAHRLRRLCGSVCSTSGFFEKYPRLAATIFWSSSCEAAMYAEHSDRRRMTIGTRACRAFLARTVDKAASNRPGR